jgi:alanine racemase
MATKFSDTTLEIDLGAIAYNFKTLRKKLGKTECAAVVKADAYGLGVKYVAPRLLDEGCKTFFVATLDEGIELRKIIGEEPQIFIFHGVKKGEEKEFLKNFLTPVINDIYQAELWNEFGQKQDMQLPAMLHFDTGMNRLGLNINDAETFHENEYEYLRIDYIMSHLYAITDQTSEQNKQQLLRINKLRKQFPTAKVSFANSGGILSAKCYHFDLARPGCALYGVNGNFNGGMKNVITLKGKIIQLRTVQENGTIGYDGLAKTKKGDRLAVIPIGYADGIHRNLTNKTHGFINGIKVPQVGRISMDMMIFKVNDVPEKFLKIGTEIEIISKNYTVDEIANNADTIGYEILTSLGKRYKRVYI